MPIQSSNYTLYRNNIATATDIFEVSNMGRDGSFRVMFKEPRIYIKTYKQHHRDTYTVSEHIKGIPVFICYDGESHTLYILADGGKIYKLDCSIESIC